PRLPRVNGTAELCHGDEPDVCHARINRSKTFGCSGLWRWARANTCAEMAHVSQGSARQRTSSAHLHHRQTGLTSSVRMTGPPRKSGASDFTKAGASPSSTHT